MAIGLSLTSSWGNGHATTWRALLKAFAARGHEVMFLERDAPWYAAHRDMPHPDFCRLELYRDLDGLRAHAAAVRDADAVVVGSYTPEGTAVGRWVQAAARGVVAFYDIDTPVTLAKLRAGDEEYLSAALIAGYHVYFSFTGGPTLQLLERTYGAPAARALYCSVDPAIYRPTGREARWDLSYLGTYSADRQPALERLLLEPARALPHRRFAVAGPQYPADIAWPANVERLEHVPPADHPAFYAQSRFTLNVTRADMIAAGYSPSVRLFEAGACATPVISDAWDGIETVLTPRREILLARGSADVIAALTALPEDARRALGEAARARILASHTAAHRARTLEAALAEAALRRRARAMDSADARR